MQASRLLALATAAAISTSAYAAADMTAAPAWHVEVRDVRIARGATEVDPSAGRLFASFDLVQQGAPGRQGESIPYVDAASVNTTNDADGSGRKAVTALTLRTGLSVSITGTRDLPVVHVEDVALVDFDQVLTKGTYVTQPRSTTTSVDLPFHRATGPVVAGGYTVDRKEAKTMRIFVVRPI